MKIFSAKKFIRIIKRATAVSIFSLMILSFQVIDCQACKHETPPEKVEIFIIGDRVADIAHNLGVLPVAMSVRASMWPEAGRFKMVSHMLGCPNKVTVMNKEIIPKACVKMGVTRLIVEKNDRFCLYKKKIKPQNVGQLIKDENITLEYVDFSQGLDEAIRQTARLLDRQAEGEELITRYKKDMARVKSKLPRAASDKKVIIFNGTYQESSGKYFVRVEAPEGYSDLFFLKPLGCINVGEAFAPEKGKVDKGHYQVQRIKRKLDLSPLIEANPDVIVMTGDAFAVQKALADFASQNPNLASVPAIKNHRIYSLPFYCDSSVLEYPSFLAQWADALSR